MIIIKNDTRDVEPYTGADHKQMVRMLLRCMASISTGRCKIIDRDDPGEPVPLRLRVGQLGLFREMLKQAMENRPIRGLVPKYRRHGISTIAQAINKFDVTTTPYRQALTVAHESVSATNIFTISRIMHQAEGWKEKKNNLTAQRIEPEGMNSLYRCSTGVGAFTGSGGTINDLHVSEFAKFKTTSQQDSRALQSFGNAVAQMSPKTIILIESSGQGPDGLFPTMCRAAAAGKSMYFCLFLPWTLDPANMIDTDDMPDEFDPPLNGDELLLRKNHGATDGQLEWRRRKLASEYNVTNYSETPPEFGWDFPTVLEDCFGQKSGRIYPDFSDKKHGVDEDPDDFGQNSFRTRGIDWGGSEHHAFVCLWVMVDPDQPPSLTFNRKTCPKFGEEHEGFSRNPNTGHPIKSGDHTTDAFRYIVSTLCLTGRVHVYRELWETNPSDAMPEKLARRIHRMSGWVHPSGDPSHPDISKFEPGPDADTFKWGTDKHDPRFSWRHISEEAHDDFRKAMDQGAGVADAAQYRLAMQFCSWGIPIVPHVKPPGPTKQGHVEDGISMVAILIAGSALFHAPKSNTHRELVMSGVAKMAMARPQEPTEEEYKAMERDRRGGDVEDGDDDDDFAWWEDDD